MQGPFLVKKKQPLPSINIKGHELEFKEELRYLGVVLDDKLIFGQCFSIKKIYHYRMFFNQKILVTLYEAYVEPVLQSSDLLNGLAIKTE